ncbi:mucosal pentraxin-like [Trematomus bernacchii]|uniref:mucosal pentraxin-like n=1 Tax=Trematomus bernacchii TaxID=40690 RepID=UPI00146F7211|nr:mucosal pentraxin-like [Trematomus bernacchii]
MKEKNMKLTTTIRKQTKYKTHKSVRCCTNHSDTGFKMALYLLLLMLTACAATPQDLSGQMFTFPQETNSAHVRLTTSRQVLSAVTLCFRSFSDLRRDITLFSLSTPSADNDFAIFKIAATDEFRMWIRNTQMDFIGQDYKLNTWHSLCSTWDSGSGKQRFIDSHQIIIIYFISGIIHICIVQL